MSRSEEDRKPPMSTRSPESKIARGYRRKPDGDR